MLNKKRGKKGQITIFIIIGILILVASATYIYVKTRILEEELPIVIPIVEKVPIEVQPIKDFIEACVYQVGTEGLILLGQQGGYMDLAGFSINDALTFSEGDNLAIPYWWHMSSDDKCTENCVFKSGVPPLHRIRPTDNSIESNLDRYVNKNLASCTGRFEDFEEQGFSFIMGDITTKSTVTKEDVVITVNWPIEVKREAKTKIKSFQTRVPVNLDRIYALGAGITDYEAENMFLEKQATDLIAGFSTLQNDRMLPPMGGSDFECGSKKIWLKTETKENLGKVLMSYVPLLQVYGGLNYVAPSFLDALKQSIYTGMIVPIDPFLSRGLETSFVYLDWPIYLNIAPSRGELIQGGDVSIHLPFLGFCMNSYDFTYDLSYPVLVQIYDPAALNGKGYYFKFAIEENLRNSEAMFTAAQEALPTAIEESLFCNANQFLTGKITIETKDAKTDSPLPGVSVAFCIPDSKGSCDANYCFIGTTKIENGKAVLTSKFPIGVGLLILTPASPDYVSAVEPYAT